MQSQTKILDDFARVASGAMGVAAGVRGEVEARIREQLERLLTQMDVVPREEFDAMKAVAVAAREEQEGLSAKVAALETRLAALEAAAKKAPSKQAAEGKAKAPSKQPAESESKGGNGTETGGR